jgi:uncharacterized small protein (DUF1192 family)
MTTTPKPAPTSAPTEQDNDAAQQIYDEWGEANDWPALVWSSLKLSDEPRWLATRTDLKTRIAAALQAERERTRAEVWDKAITTLHQMKYDYQSIYRHEEGVDLCLAAIVRLESARVFEAAQLPQGE